MDSTDGWAGSARAWIANQGEHGDFGRRYVLDGPMLERIRAGGFRRALDVGCGEGRFCRLMQAEGLRTVGLDPTEALIGRARERDPGGDYRLGRAETFQSEAGAFDLVVSYLSLIDIPDLTAAIAAMVQALRPGGALLIANLNSFHTAGMPDGWKADRKGAARFSIDHYLDERAVWVEWAGIRVQNWHRPMGAYFSRLLDAGLELRHFAEPVPTGGDPQMVDRYRRVPYFHLMEWRKPAAP